MRDIYIDKIHPRLVKSLGLFSIVFQSYFGPLFILGIAGIYVVRRLTKEAVDYDKLLELAREHHLSEAIITRDLSTYSFILNNNMPLIAEVCMLLLAWYVFHSRVYTQMSRDFYDRKAWIYLVISAILLVTGITIYYYFKLDIRIKYSSWRYEHANGVKVMGNMRIKRILSDSVAFAIVLVLLELITRYYQKLVEKIDADYSWRFKLTDYFQTGIILLFFIWFGLHPDDPQPLMSGRYYSWDDYYWKELLREFLLVSGYGIIIFFLQNYFYQMILVDERRVQERRELGSVLFRLVFAMLAGFTILVAYYLKSYHYSSSYYIEYDLSTFQDPYSLTEFLITVFQYSLISNTICFIIATSIAYIRRVQTKLSSKTAELANLRAQIHPHFLFNTLSNLHSTAMDENSKQTAEGILQLSGLMRFMLRESNQERVPLQKEIEYLNNYIRLQRKRLDQSREILIHVYFQDTDREIELAPMLLQPLIENAFKHGIGFSRPSWIFITLTMDAENLYFKVHNSFHNMEQKDKALDKSGVGLENVRKRLEIIYPKRHQFILQQTETDFFVAVTLML